MSIEEQRSRKCCWELKFIEELESVVLVYNRVYVVVGLL